MYIHNNARGLTQINLWANRATDLAKTTRDKKGPPWRHFHGQWIGVLQETRFDGRVASFLASCPGMLKQIACLMVLLTLLVAPCRAD